MDDIKDDIQDDNNQMQENDSQQVSEAPPLSDDDNLEKKQEKNIDASQNFETKTDGDSNNINGQGQEVLDNHQKIQAVYDIPVQVSAVLGKATMPVESLLKLGRGAVVALDRKVGEAIDIYVNNLLVARGEVVVVDDHLGVTMTEIIKSIR
jgi:flagellar motor switch protein FliN/FliY